MSHPSLSRVGVALGILAPLVMSGCANLPRADAARPGETAAVAPSALRDDAPGNAAHADAPGAPRPGPAATPYARPFAEMVKDAKETAGLFNIWQKVDKVFIELSPDQFDKPFFFKSAINQGIG